MKLRHAAALALLIVATGCSPEISAINSATARAETSAAWAESAASRADAAASRAEACATRAADAAAKSERSVLRAYDAVARLCAVWSVGDIRAEWPECREAKIENDAVRRALSQLSHAPEVSVKDWALALTCVPGREAHVE